MTRSRATLGAITVLFIAGLLLWGAGSGEPLMSAPSVELADVPAPGDEAAATMEALPPEQAAETSTEEDDGGVNTVLIVQVAIATLVAWLVLRWFRNREPDEPGGFVDAQPSDELDLLVEATADTKAGLDADRHGEPRNAVVACWVALEDALVSAGEAPKAGETSLDVTQRVLHRWQVEPEPLSRLADLFREARFSRHPITSENAAEARRSLEQIHAGLARAAARRDRASAASSDDNTSAGMP